MGEGGRTESWGEGSDVFIYAPNARSAAADLILAWFPVQSRSGCTRFTTTVCARTANGARGDSARRGWRAKRHVYRHELVSVGRLTHSDQ